MIQILSIVFKYINLNMHCKMLVGLTNGSILVQFKGKLTAYEFSEINT